MPSPAHEIPLQLLHDHPALLGTLLEKLGGRAPEGVLQPVDTNLRFADPAEVRPDLVFRAERPRWLLLELQNRIDPDKGRRWIAEVLGQLNQEAARPRTKARRVARKPPARTR